MGIRTLWLVGQTPSLFDAPRIKVSRSEVRHLMLVSLPAAFTNGSLHRLRDALS
jgi:hypothetical protein